MPLPDEIIARFKLHYRCLNCERNICRQLDVPAADGAPRDVDELLESAFLKNQRYSCDTCDSFIGTLIAVQSWGGEEMAA